MDARELEELVNQVTREVLARARNEPAEIRRLPAAAKRASARTPRDLARLIDHTLLKPEATREQIERLCEEARRHEFAAVCVNPNWVTLCAERLRGSPVAVCTVVGFPLGATTPDSKAFEAGQACRNGAAEIDMVINVGALKGGDYEMVALDIRAVIEEVHRHGAIVKVIIETALLTDTEKVEACTIAKSAGADFVKTSTGFAKSGATIADVALMRATVGPEVGVKAAGGMRSYEDALAMLAAGATRLGTSAGVQIVEGVGATSRQTY